MSVVGVIHKFEKEQNWDNVTSIYINWHGGNSNTEWQVLIAAPNDANWFAFFLKTSCSIHHRQSKKLPLHPARLRDPPGEDRPAIELKARGARALKAVPVANRIPADRRTKRRSWSLNVAGMEAARF